MHVLYVHQNFPAQFGHIAKHLVEKLGWQCSFVSQTPGGVVAGINKIQYKTAGGATVQNHFCSRTFENTVWHCDGVYHAMKAHPEIKPDLIVGHSGFGSTLFLRELYPTVPIINFFEYYYRAHDPDSDMDFRKDLAWPVGEMKYLRSRCRNAMILLDLQNCQSAYTPTQFQRSRFPNEYQSKLRCIFDGVDRSIYHGYAESLRPPLESRGTRHIGGVSVPASTRVVTYVSRGFESMRGFDIFMKSAKIIAQRFPDVLFFVVGSEKMSYGGDEEHIKPFKTFKEWTFAQENYDLSKFVFIPGLEPAQLGRLLATTDLHIYLTVPFVLSWSMMDALSCGAVVLASSTTPVKEMIRHGENGLLADFFSPEDFADKAIEALRDPAAARTLGRAAEKMIVEKYSLEAVVPEMVQLYEQAAQVKLEGWALPPHAPDLSQKQVQVGHPPPQPNRPSPFL
ncbi:MAG TPA: glycosyltransferase [Tepidisphaeraceae bacterium]|jgi:glycosyltransferase involved in cell wall biosynthesis